MAGEQFLMESLREPRFTYPIPPDAYGIYQQALQSGLALRRADETSRQNAANQALLEARVAQLPYDRRYNQELLNSQIIQNQAHAELYRANAAAKGAPAATVPSVFDFWGAGSSGGSGTDALPVGDGDTSGGAILAGGDGPAPALAPTVPASAFQIPTFQLGLPSESDQLGLTNEVPATAADATPAPDNSTASAAPAPAATDWAGQTIDFSQPGMLREVHGAESPLPVRTATVFGTNMDGSPDREDNGVTAFGDNSRDPAARIGSIPIAEAIERDRALGGPGTVGHYKARPAGERMMRVSNPATGRSTLVENRELGPSPDAPSGATLDVTPAVMREVGGDGKAALQMQFVSNGDAGSGDLRTVGNNSPAPAAAPRIAVPRTADEAADLQNRFNIAKEGLLATPEAANPRLRTKILQEVASVQQTITRSVQQFKNAEATRLRQQGVAAHGTGGRGGAGEIDDVPAAGDRQPIAKTAKKKLADGTEVTFDYSSPNDRADEAEHDRQARTDALEKDVKLQTGGATIADLLNDAGHFDGAPVDARGNPARDPNSAAAGGTNRPGTHYFIKADGSRGALPEPLYQSLRQRIDPLVYGQGNAPAVAPSPAPASVLPAAAPAPIQIPEFNLLNASNPGRTGLSNMSAFTSAPIALPQAPAPAPQPVSDASAPPDVRLRNLRAADYRTRFQAQQQDNARQETDQAEAGKRTAAERPVTARRIAEAFDHSIPYGQDNRPPDRNAIFAGIERTARELGLSNYDPGEVTTLLRARATEQQLERERAAAAPGTVDLARELTVRERSLPTGFNPVQTKAGTATYLGL